MPSPKTTEVIRKCCHRTAIVPDTIGEAMARARAALRDATIEATDLQFDLADVADVQDRQQGVEEMNQKLGGFLREAGRLRDQMERVLGIAREIDEATPRIAEKLGVDLGEG